MEYITFIAKKATAFGFKVSLLCYATTLELGIIFNLTALFKLLTGLRILASVLTSLGRFTRKEPPKFNAIINLNDVQIQT